MRQPCILYPFLLVSRMKPDIEIQIFFSAVMLDLELWFPRHRPGGIEYLISILVKHRGFGTTEIVFEVEACASVFQFGLLELRILLISRLDFRHLLSNFVVIEQR